MLPIISIFSIVVIASGLWWLKNKKPFIATELVFQAKKQKLSFHYPLGWTIKIADDVGYVFGPKNAWIRLWFALDNGIQLTCNTKTGPVEITSSQPVILPGLDLPLRYIEAILPAHTKPDKYIVYFGLAPDQTPFNQPQTFVTCLDDVKNNILAPGNSTKAIIEFHSLMYTNEFDAFIFATKAEALNFFQTNEYKQAKQIILSVKFGS